MELPRYLYKYGKIDKNLISSLINQEIWFADPDTFNDPYDCKLFIDTNNTIQEIEGFFHKANKRYTDYLLKIENPIEQLRFLSNWHRDKISQNSLFAILEDILNKRRLIFLDTQIEKRIKDIENNIEKLDSIINISAQNEKKNYRILCLSKKINHSTMWAHYTDNHKGICLKLDTKAMLSFFEFPIKVDYPKEYPVFNFINQYEDRKVVQHIYGTKHISWKYEKEIRIIKNISLTQFRKSGLFKFDRELINGIYFGLKCNTSDIEIIKELNDKYYNGKIKLYKAKEKQRSFKIDFERME